MEARAARASLRAVPEGPGQGSAYRQVASDLRHAIGLLCVPHYTTLQKASRRLLKQSRVRVLLDQGNNVLIGSRVECVILTK